MRATNVTQIVPTMNGQRPNSPLNGDQADEKRSEETGFSTRMARAFPKSANSIRRTTLPGRKVRTNISLRAIRSLSALTPVGPSPLTE
ncbi:MAG: hypothetical protein A2Y69_03545 [Candidatus Aminicenantes bacterium RBG_13_59_9]|nr:MAG: hypothetical protein A2Y69_03545 [Candidatus Aminicenantes bacterium RBG_13_59_9]